MRALIQRVGQASVKVKGTEEVHSIESGLLVLLGVGKNDTAEQARILAQKIANLRIFPNDKGKFDRSLLDVAGHCLVISQFTLYADAARGRRPDFTAAADPQKAADLYKLFIEELKASGLPKIEEGWFQAHMEVALINDGPVTVMLEV